MSAKRVICIGREAFVLSPDGEVVRTMVAGLDENGYWFLDGSSNRRPHWFIFKDAVSAASDHINTRQTALRKALRALARKRKVLETQTYRDGVMSEPYKVVDLKAMMNYGQSRRPRKLKKIKIQVPEMYLIPGDMVYMVITPMTLSESREYTYRPHEHFVLETAVKSMCFSPDWQVHYTFSTPFIVKEFFLSRKAAEVKLQSSSELGTKDLVPFVSNRQEKEEIAKISDDIPF